MRPRFLFVCCAYFAWCFVAACSQLTSNEDTRGRHGRQIKNTDTKGLCVEGGVGYKACHQTGVFCTAVDTKQTFQCDCLDEKQYYDANDTKCKHWKSCDPNPCLFGKCADQDGKKPRTCSCPKMKDLFEDCQIKDNKKIMCERAEGKAKIDPSGAVYCDCGPGKTYVGEKCELTTCIDYGMTCKELCVLKLLDKDNRCCQGWNISDCSESKKDITSCTTGSIMVDGECQDACTANQAAPICPDGCTALVNGRPYECKCKSGFELAGNGKTCREKHTCNEEEKNNCHESEICSILDSRPVCTCAEGQQRLSGVCTDKCHTKCDHKFAKCVIKNRNEQCSCIGPFSADERGSQMCALAFYSYILTFQTTFHSSYSDREFKNISKALKVLFGKELLKIETVNWGYEIVLRLVFQTKQHPAVLRRMSHCQYPKGDGCLFPPNLNVKSSSLKDLEEEDLCGDVLQGVFNLPDGISECIKKEDNYTIRCKEGFIAYNEVVSGRLRRWSCKGPATQMDVTSETGIPETTTGMDPEGKETTPKSGDPCVSSPCLNGGDCRPASDETFICECKKGFSGKRCETNSSGKLEAQAVAIITMSIIMQVARLQMFGMA